MKEAAQNFIHTDHRELPKRERRSFTKDELEILVKNGYTANYLLTGNNIITQMENGRKFWSRLPSYKLDLFKEHSLVGEIAINPVKLFLPQSNNLTLSQQLEKLEEYSDFLQKQLGTKKIEAIMGSAADYTELAYAHLDSTGEILFGKEYGFGYARTQTPTIGWNVGNVGSFFGGKELGVNDFDQNLGKNDIYVAPLVVAV